MSQVIIYKCGYIYLNYPDGKTEVIRVQVDKNAYVKQVKSYRAAQIAITKHLKSGRAIK